MSGVGHCVALGVACGLCDVCGVCGVFDVFVVCMLCGVCVFGVIGVCVVSCWCVSVCVCRYASRWVCVCLVWRGGIRCYCVMVAASPVVTMARRRWLHRNYGHHPRVCVCVVCTLGCCKLS